MVAYRINESQKKERRLKISIGLHRFADTVSDLKIWYSDDILCTTALLRSNHFPSLQYEIVIPPSLRLIHVYINFVQILLGQPSSKDLITVASPFCAAGCSIHRWPSCGKGRRQKWGEGLTWILVAPGEVQVPDSPASRIGTSCSNM